jgi:hypothetical protein
MSPMLASRSVTCARRPSASAATARVEINFEPYAVPMLIRHDAAQALTGTSPAWFQRSSDPPMRRHLNGNHSPRLQSP